MKAKARRRSRICLRRKLNPSGKNAGLTGANYECSRGRFPGRMTIAPCCLWTSRQKWHAARGLIKLNEGFDLTRLSLWYRPEVK
jgi:hypothetical protein